MSDVPLLKLHKDIVDVLQQMSNFIINEFFDQERRLKAVATRLAICKKNEDALLSRKEKFTEKLAKTAPPIQRNEYIDITKIINDDDSVYSDFMESSSSTDDIDTVYQTKQDKKEDTEYESEF